MIARSMPRATCDEKGLTHSSRSRWSLHRRSVACLRKAFKTCLAGSRIGIYVIHSVLSGVSQTGMPMVAPHPRGRSRHALRARTHARYATCSVDIKPSKPVFDRAIGAAWSPSECPPLSEIGERCQFPSSFFGHAYPITPRCLRAKRQVNRNVVAISFRRGFGHAAAVVSSCRRTGEEVAVPLIEQPTCNAASKAA